MKLSLESRHKERVEFRGQPSELLGLSVTLGARSPEELLGRLLDIAGGFRANFGTAVQNPSFQAKFGKAKKR